MPKRITKERIRGWMPKEPIFQTCHAPVNPNKSLMVQWTARALVAGTFASATLLILGDTTGLAQGMGKYLWYAGVESTVWGAVAAVPFLATRKPSSQGKAKNE
jgi:hypothetical protein